MDLGAKYRSPRQARDDIRLQKKKRLKTAKSQAGPIRDAWRWQAACPCARAVRPPFSLTSAKCSRRARRGTSLRRALGAASREQLTPSCASSSLLYRNGAKPRWTCSTRRAAWRSSGALAQQHVAWTMEGSVILLILRARRHRYDIGHAGTTRSP